MTTGAECHLNYAESEGPSDGFVVRQASLVERTIWVSTFGEGVNTGPWHAWMNSTLGPQGFEEYDEVVKGAVRSRKGSLD